MYKSVLGILLVLSASFFPILSFAFVDFVELEKDDHLILLLGDVHSSQFDSINQAHAERFIKNIEILEKYSQNASPSSKRTSVCYFELSNEIARHLRTGKAPDGTCAITFQILAVNSLENENRSVCKLIPFEPRGTVSDHSAGGFDWIREQMYQAFAELSAKPEHGGLKATSTYLDLQRQILQADPSTLAILRERGVLNIIDYQKYALGLVKRVGDLRSHYKEDTLEFKEFTRSLTELKSAYGKILKLFAPFKGTDFLFHALFRLADKSDAPIKALTQLEKALQSDFEYRYADAEFLDKLLSDRDKDPLSARIMITGAGHTEGLKVALLSLGYKIRSEAISVYTEKEIDSSGAISTTREFRPDLEKKLYEALTRFHFSNDPDESKKTEEKKPSPQVQGSRELSARRDPVSTFSATRRFSAPLVVILAASFLGFVKYYFF